MERERYGRKIAAIAARHRCSTGAVRKILSRYYNTGEVTGGKRSDRLRSFSNVEMQKLDKTIRRKPTATATTLANEVFKNTGKRVSPRTINRYRRELESTY
ncbi:unnamed protein product [Rotaria sp. Silwood2]|nr:unnamed protein product [Rotaria sp. Silwood2]CAF4333906.1 unnamed protein product [Rotaria sp. Silwood2]